MGSSIPIHRDHHLAGTLKREPVLRVPADSERTAARRDVHAFFGCKPYWT
ncbi:MAG: hypothetical protein ABI624_15875 [Casimicrobiaceae bacterium]